MLDVNAVYRGDCLEVMNEIDDKSIDMVLCDMPYGVTTSKWDIVIPLDPLWAHYKRIIKDNGAIILTATQPFATQLINSNTKMFRYELIWEKDNFSNPLNANIRPLQVHENILVFYKKLPIYNPQKKEGKPYYGRSHGKGMLSHVREIKVGIPPGFYDGLRFPRSVIKIPKERQKSLHTNQKPLALFDWLIKTYTNEGMLVLDNCAGSGTTAISCIKNNRNYLLIEKDEHFYNVCNERIKEYKGEI